jgi:hypothetical protein
MPTNRQRDIVREQFAREDAAATADYHRQLAGQAPQAIHPESYRQQMEEQLRQQNYINLQASISAGSSASTPPPQFNIRIDRGFIPFEINHQKLNVSLEPTQRGVRMSLLSTRGTNRRVIIQLSDHHGQVLQRVPQDDHFHYGIQMVDRDGYLLIPEVKERA